MTVLKCDYSNQSYYQYELFFPVVLFIMLYKAFLTFESVDKILKCDNSFESYLAALSCVVVYYSVQGGSYF